MPLSLEGNPGVLTNVQELVPIMNMQTVKTKDPNERVLPLCRREGLSRTEETDERETKKPANSQTMLWRQMLIKVGAQSELKTKIQHCLKIRSRWRRMHREIQRQHLCLETSMFHCTGEDEVPNR